MDSSRSPPFAAEANGGAALAGVLAVATAMALALAVSAPGPLAWSMVAHIGSMNVAAPVAAIACHQLEGCRRPWGRPGVLWAATLVQLAILWAAHSPALHGAMHAGPPTAAAVHALLFAAALAFWLSILGAGGHRWQAMLALLVSGKFACLLGVLFVFAPRSLFGPHDLHGAHAWQGAHLADQHLAGLLMLAACPLSYVLTAVVLAVQAVNALEQPQGLRTR